MAKQTLDNEYVFLRRVEIRKQGETFITQTTVAVISDLLVPFCRSKSRTELSLGWSSYGLMSSKPKLKN